MTYLSTLEIYSNLFLKIILSIIIVYIAYKPKSVRQLVKQILIFYVTSFLFGGVAFAMIYVVKPQEILMKNGLFLGTYPLKTVFVGAIIASIILITAFKIVKTKISKNDMYCDIEIYLNGKTVTTTAMVDTGNLLKDPLTGNPVMVVEASLLENILPKEILQNIEAIIGGNLLDVTEEIKMQYLAKLKLIPYSSLGKQYGMLLGIKADKVVFFQPEEDIQKDNIVLGLYTKSLTKKGEYRALIGLELMSAILN